MPNLLVQASIDKRPRVVIDYRATLNSGATLAQSDFTYLISGNVSCSSLTLEGGTVIKHKAGTSITVGTLTCKTSQWRPAIFSAVDDDTVGQTMYGYDGSGYTGQISSGGYGNPCLKLGSTSLTASGCVFRYAQKAVQYVASAATDATITVSHCQFFNCIRGIDLTWAAGSGSGSSGPPAGCTVTITVNNGLMAGVQYPLNVSNFGAAVVSTFLNCTFDQVTYLVGGAWTGTLTFKSINTVYANIAHSINGYGYTFLGNNNGYYNAANAPQFSLPRFTVSFHSVGAGHYYLTDDPGFRHAGATSGLPTWLVSDLRQRTTQPPGVVPPGTPFSADTKFPSTPYPPAPRDTGSGLDLGYHYDPIDWALANCTATANLVFAPGTVIATYATSGSPNSPGLTLNPGAQLFSIGTPTQAVWIVEYNTVQESPGTWQKTTFGSLVSKVPSQTPFPTVICRFTKWSMLADDDNNFVASAGAGPLSFRDCEFYGGMLSSTAPTLNFINCLFDRVQVSSTPTDVSYASYFQNNTFHGGSLTLNAPDWAIKDNIFDQTTLTISGTHSASHNAYVNVAPYGAVPGDVAPIPLAVSPTYAVGPLGSYYLNTSGNPSLIGGDTTLTAGAVGLYHNTVKIDRDGNQNQYKEGNSLLSIGHHYIALNSGNGPIDSHADTLKPTGVPPLGDYLKDSNGSGVFDDGDIANWTVSHTFRRVEANHSPFYSTIGAAYLDVIGGTTGDIVLVENGTYFEVVQLNKNGTATSPVTVRAANIGGAAIDGQDQLGTDQTGSSEKSVVTIDADCNVLRGFEIKRGYVKGVNVVPPCSGCSDPINCTGTCIGSTHNQVLNNHIHHNGHLNPFGGGTGSAGIYSAPGAGYNTYIANYVHDNGRIGDLNNAKYDHGFYLSGTTGEFVANNIIVNNAGHGIQVAGKEKTIASLSIYNNTIVGNSGGGIIFWGCMEGIDVANNIIYGSPYGVNTCSAFAGSPGATVTIRYTLFFNNGTDMSTACLPGCDDPAPSVCGASPPCVTFDTTSCIPCTSGNPCNLTGFDPSFFNPVTDWHLRSGSVAVGNGVNLYNPPPSVVTDYEGKPRPQSGCFDIGAYQR